MNRTIRKLASTLTGAVLLITGGAVTAAPASAAPAAQAALAASTYTPPQTTYDTVVLLMVEALNAQRAKKGLRPVAYSAALSKETKKHLDQTRDVWFSLPGENEARMRAAFGSDLIVFDGTKAGSGGGGTQLEEIRSAVEWFAKFDELQMATAKYIGVGVAFEAPNKLIVEAYVADSKGQIIKADPLPGQSAALNAQVKRARSAYASAKKSVVSAKKSYKKAKAIYAKARKLPSEVQIGRNEYFGVDLFLGYNREAYLDARKNYRAAVKHRATTKKLYLATQAAVPAGKMSPVLAKAETTRRAAAKAKKSAKSAATNAKRARSTYLMAKDPVRYGL